MKPVLLRRIGAGTKGPFVAAAILYATFIWRSSFLVGGRRFFSLFDDAMVSMTYAQNLALGHGLVWNLRGDPVAGYTNPLWTLIMAAEHRLGLSENLVPLLVMLSGSVTLFLSGLMARRIVQQLSPEARWAPRIALWLVLLYYPLIFWTLRGMEVGLFTLLVLVGMERALRLTAEFRRKDLYVLCASMGAGALTRIDFVVPSFVIAGFLFLMLKGTERGLAIWSLGVTTASVLAIQFAFNFVYYGASLPNTYALKVLGVSLGTRLARGVISSVFIAALTLGTAISIALLAYLDGSRQIKRGLHFIFSLFVALNLYSIWAGADAWELFQFPNRYVTPGVVALLIATAIGIEQLIISFRSEPGRRWQVMVGFTVVAVLGAHFARELPLEKLQIFPSGPDMRPFSPTLLPGLSLIVVTVLALLNRGRRDLRRTVERPLLAGVLTMISLVTLNAQAAKVWWDDGPPQAADDAANVRYGLLLRELTSPGARIAVVFAGAPRYYSRRDGVDLLGKADRVIAHSAAHKEGSFRPGHNKWDYQYSIGQLRPDVIAQLWHVSGEDFARFSTYGYVPVAPTPDLASLARPWPGVLLPHLLVRSDSSWVRWDRLLRLPPP